MTLQEAYNFIESLKTEATKKYEIKVYEKFLHILSELKIREFSKDEIQSIETELESLDLKSNPENKKKFIKKALTKFEKYLKDTFSLTSKGYYINLYGGLGLSFGLLFGVAILSNLERSLGISLGLIGGMVVGSLIGRQKETQVKAAGKML
ncbi:hypothetical protein [Lutibacter sp.]|uniref:hypothetical protein n=1 Tax=Lutibacter sp. TaxID=1925666 RepID=UPI0034A00BE5